jgi:8-oxo-dGTP diphosphatase
MARRKLEKGGSAPDVRAAGGVMLRRRRPARTRVAVIHRPKYMDWSLPKGKLEEGESFEQAALREVEEETGFKAKQLDELPPVSYLDRKGRSKLVRYWLMEPLEGSFEPHDEVDEVRWLTRREALKILTYDHDRELVDAAMRPRRVR